MKPEGLMSFREWLECKMSFFFSVTPEDLGRLSPSRAVTVFRDLVYAEAKLVKVDLCNVDIPSSEKAISTSDGGVDGQVSNARPLNSGHGIIKDGLTCYQVKTGAESASTVSAAKGIISTKNGVCERVRDCIENDGTFIVVLFGSDKPDTESDQAKKCVQKAIAELMPDYPNYEKVEVWHQSKLVGFLQDFPSLCLAVKQYEPTALRTIDAWANLNDMRHNTVLGPSQRRVVKAIRESVRNGGGEAIRVIGEAGVGKTRLLLEALNDDKCRGQVIYADKPSAIPVGFVASLVMSDSQERCILVIDECDSAKCGEYWNQIAPVAERVKLITIFNDVESAKPGHSIVKIDPLVKNDVKEIIGSYGIPDYRSSVLAELCSGSPRIAHMLGEQISVSGNFDILSLDDVWNRCLAGSDDPQSDAARNRIRVLKWLSLFRRFGYEGPYKAEGDLVLSMIERSTGLKNCTTREIIHGLRNRKFLQGDYTLYITPRMLHIWLWVKWWEEQGPGFIYSDFKRVDDERELSNQLLDCFFEMLQYARDSPVAPRVIASLLSDEGPFASPEFLESESGVRLISLLADICPRETLAFIERRLSPMGTGELLKLHLERRGYVEALWRITKEEQFFVRACEMLLKLALAENESYSNNATGVFCGLFSNGVSKLAASKASPEKRFPFLQHVAKTDDRMQQAIVVQAISCGLEMVTSALQPVREVDLLHREASGWLPLTFGEWRDAYRRIWLLGMECLESFDDENREKLAREMTKRAFSLLEFIGDGSEVASWIADLAVSGHADNEELIVGISRSLEYSQRLSDGVRESLKSLQEELTGTGYENEMIRYVGMNVFEDEYGEEGDRSHVLDDKLNGLAKQSIADQSAFRKLLPWLSSDEPNRSFRFGLALGRADVAYTQWTPIIDSLLEIGEGEGTVEDTQGASYPNPQFCSGYLRAMAENDAKKCEQCIFEVARTNRIAEIVPTLASFSVMNDRILSLIIELYDSGDVSTRALFSLRFGDALKSASLQLVESLLKLLVAKNEPLAAVLAIHIAYGVERDGRRLSIESKLAIATQPALYERREGPVDPHIAFPWSVLCSSLLDIAPQLSREVVAFVLEALLSDIKWHRSYLEDVLRKAAMVNPSSTWEEVAPFIEGKCLEAMACFGDFLNLDSHQYKKPIDWIPNSTIIEWVDEDSSERAPVLAGTVASDLRDEDGKPTIARELLVKHGDDERVFRALQARESSYSWSGSQVAALNAKIDRLNSYRAGETDPNVLLWIDATVCMFENEIGAAHAQEEREA